MIQSFPFLLFPLMRISASVKHADGEGSPAWKEENGKCKNAAGIPEKCCMKLKMSSKDSDQDHVFNLCSLVFFAEMSSEMTVPSFLYSGANAKLSLRDLNASKSSTVSTATAMLGFLR